jgi:hypothetical protein
MFSGTRATLVNGRSPTKAGCPVSQSEEVTLSGISVPSRIETGRQKGTGKGQCEVALQHHPCCSEFRTKSERDIFLARADPKQTLLVSCPFSENRTYLFPHVHFFTRAYSEGWASFCGLKIAVCSGGRMTHSLLSGSCFDEKPDKAPLK